MVPGQIVELDADMLTEAATLGVTVMLPVAFTEPHPPVSGIL